MKRAFKDLRIGSSGGAMNGRLIVRALSMLLFVLALAGLGYGRPALAQTARPAASPAVADVRQIVTNARKEIESYTRAGGAAGAADHPAIKWHAALWEGHQRSPQSEAGAEATPAANRPLRPAPPAAAHAGGLTYEIGSLSSAPRAPAIPGKRRTGRHVVDLAAFRGKPIVLVFWAST